MLRIHIEFKNGDLQSMLTNRITYGTPLFPGKLICGTIPDCIFFEMEKISFFWIEHE